MLPEDLAITPALLRRFEGEAELEGGDGRHYAVIQRNDGSILVHHPASPQLSPMQMIWAADALKLLNREIHHDGAWVVVFTHPKPQLENIFQDAKHADYRRYVLLWMDRDGDVQIPIEWLEGDNEDFRTFTDVIMAGVHSTAQKAEGCWQVWHTMMIEVLEPREGQTFKRAQGERAPSAH